MDIPGIKRSAGKALSQASGSPTRLVLIHSAVLIGASLLMTLVSWLLSAVAPAGGISNLGAHTILSTIEVVLNLALTVAKPFWQAGLIFAALALAKQKTITSGALAEGLRRPGAILSSLIFRVVQYLLIGFVCVYISYTLLMLSPFSSVLNEAAVELTETPPASMSGMVKLLMVVFSVICVLAFAVLAVPVYYRYRMVEYIIMDDPDKGGLEALRLSSSLMRGNKMRLFKLDLSFWWFYLLDGLISLLCVGGTILSALGLTLPLWLFPVVGLLCRVILYALAKPKLMVTYALFYNALPQMEPPKPKAPSKPQPPKKQPWKY